MERIEFALENSKNFVFLCTDNSLSSEWVRMEYETFLNEFHVKDKINRKLIVQKGNAPLSQKIPLLLRRLQFSDSIDSILNSISIISTEQYKTITSKNRSLPVQSQNLKKNKNNRIQDSRIKLNYINIPILDPNKYIPSNPLIDALNASIGLGQPLLLSGEPGVGKTQFAYYVAHSLNLSPPYAFNVKSTSLVKDLFYRYKKGHLHFVQINRNVLSNEDIEQRYISYLAIGAAIRANERKIVLIDEIDKAPREFPNDLLNAIEGLGFYVSELGLHYTTKPENRPIIIIIITNSERNLPDAFLRRCVYYHIHFPSEEHLFEMLKNRFSTKREDDFLKRVLQIFSLFRNTALRKKPSTAELMAWVETLIALNITNFERNEQKERMFNSLSVIFKTVEDLSNAKEILFKNKN